MDTGRRFSPRDALPLMTEVLNRGGSFRLSVTGNSMLPFLRHGQDGVILAPLSRSPRPGDMLFYLRTPEVCILHRVHRIEPDGRILMCGDSQLSLEPIREPQILAIATHVERGGTQISCSGAAWRLTSFLWRRLHPVRPRLLGLLKRLGFIHYAVPD